MSESVVSVFAALQGVLQELPSIAKVPHPTQDGRGLTYAYRGIEEITSEAQPLFAKHGVIFAPNVESHEVKDIIVNGNPWTDTTLRVRYDIYGPTGDLVQVTTIGIGRDNSDKGANKAMSQAFKYALLQVFCIADQNDDTDGTAVTADARPLAMSERSVAVQTGTATQVAPPAQGHGGYTPKPITEKQGKALWAISGGGQKFNLNAICERVYGKREADLTSKEASELIDGLNSGAIDTSAQVAGAEQVAAAFGAVVQNPEDIPGYNGEPF